MDSLSTMNNALAYIEEHLTEEIDYREVSKIAYYSECHFKRMFSFLSGISLSEYIRRRRLTLAALELKDNDFRIIDAVVKYGYRSADSFSRAFHSIHDILPFKVFGARYTRSGSRLQDMRRLKVLKFCGMRAPTLAIRSIEAKFGFQ